MLENRKRCAKATLSALQRDRGKLRVEHRWQWGRRTVCRSLLAHNQLRLLNNFYLLLSQQCTSHDILKCCCDTSTFRSTDVRKKEKCDGKGEGNRKTIEFLLSLSNIERTFCQHGECMETSCLPWFSVPAHVFQDRSLAPFVARAQWNNAAVRPPNLQSSWRVNLGSWRGKTWSRFVIFIDKSWLYAHGMPIFLKHLQRTLFGT